MYSSHPYQTIPDAWIEHDEKVRSYVWLHRLVAFGQFAVLVAAVGTLLLTYKALTMEVTLGRSITNSFALWMVYFSIIGSLWKLFSFPFEVANHFIEKKFSLTKQEFAGWLTDNLKATLVGVVLGFVTIVVLYLTSHFFSYNRWWIAAYIFFMGFSILLAQLAPILLVPMFFKLEPMPGGALKSRLLALCSNFKVKVQEVYHLGLGEKTEKGNAAFLGIGSTKRIMIGDTLYKKYSADEVEAVFAHELGHQVHNDLWKSIGVEAVLSLFSFYFAHWFCLSIVFVVYGTEIGRPFGMFLFLICLTLVRFPVRIVQVAFSRYMEKQADSFASNEANVGEPLADALEKLTLQNFSYFNPHPIIEFISYSHPAPWRRIMALRGGI